MIVPVDAFLTRLRTWLPGSVLPEERLERIRGVARLLPEISGCIALECRLEAGAPQVDYMVGCIPEDGCPEALVEALSKAQDRLEGPLWSGVRAFARRWSDPTSVLAQVPAFWIEYDLDGPPSAAPRPFAFACVQPTLARHPPLSRSHSGATFEQSLQLTWQSLESFQGGPVPPGIARKVRQCFDALPDRAQVAHVATMACRGSEAVRMVLGISPRDAADYLKRIGWPGPHSQIAKLAAEWLDDKQFVDLNVDVAEELGPTLGFGFSLPARPHDLAARRLFDRLVRAGMCAPEKRDAFLAFPGRESVLLPGHRWPLSLVRTAGIKLVCRPNEPLAAKLYPYLEYRFSLRREL